MSTRKITIVQDLEVLRVIDSRTGNTYVILQLATKRFDIYFQAGPKYKLRLRFPFSESIDHALNYIRQQITGRP